MLYTIIVVYNYLLFIIIATYRGTFILVIKPKKMGLTNMHFRVPIKG